VDDNDLSAKVAQDIDRRRAEVIDDIVRRVRPHMKPGAGGKAWRPRDEEGKAVQIVIPVLGLRFDAITPDGLATDAGRTATINRFSDMSLVSLMIISDWVDAHEWTYFPGE
jgi:hypothetical protein